MWACLISGDIGSPLQGLGSLDLRDPAPDVDPRSSVLSCDEPVLPARILMEPEEFTARDPQTLACSPFSSVNHAPQIAKLKFLVNKYAYSVCCFYIWKFVLRFTKPGIVYQFVFFRKHIRMHQ
jgi:hypothetical protein